MTWSQNQLESVRNCTNSNWLPKLRGSPTKVVFSSFRALLDNEQEQKWWLLKVLNAHVIALQQVVVIHDLDCGKGYPNGKTVHVGRPQRPSGRRQDHHHQQQHPQLRQPLGPHPEKMGPWSHVTSYPFIAGWFMMETPTKMNDDWGYPYDSGNHQT